MKIKRALAISTTALCLVAASAVAHVQTKADPDDWSDQLDIKSARLNHTDARLVVGIRAYEDWATGALDNRTIYFTLDTKGGNAPDFGVNINKGNDGLQCLVTIEPNGELVGNGRARRDGTNGASCSFKRTDVAAGGSKTIRWHASVYNLETFEHDDAPDTGMVRHQI
jgi:hypothetical protein